MHARSKGQPSDGQPSCSVQTQQQRQRKATSARQPEARPARTEDMQNETASSSQQPQHHNKRKAYDPWQQLINEEPTIVGV
jgi:hypothetical protein